MPDIKQLLQDEIRRLARKEIKLAVQALNETSAMLRKQLSAQKKSLTALEKQVSLFSGKEPVDAVKAPSKTEDAVKVRLNAKGIVRIRKKIKVTQDVFAALIGVAPHTVSLWEQGRTSPRAAQKSKICAFRTIGKRELKKQLAALGAVKKAKTE